jgi:hypothetical protein
MEARGGDLVSAAEGKAHSSPQAKASQDQAGGHEILLSTVVLAILKES